MGGLPEFRPARGGDENPGKLWQWVLIVVSCRKSRFRIYKADWDAQDLITRHRMSKNAQPERVAQVAIFRLAFHRLIRGPV